MHQEEVDEKAHQEAHEPRVVVEHPERGNHQADKSDSGAGRQGRDGRPIEAARIFVATLPPIKVLDNEKLLADDEVVAKDRKSTRLNSSHLVISYAVFCLKKKIVNASAAKLN